MNDHRRALEALREAIGRSNYVGYRSLVVEVLAPGAEILLRAGDPATATVLVGSLLEGVLPAINSALSQRYVDLERSLVAVHEALGDEQYQRMFARGAAMSYEEIVDFALAEVRRAIDEATDG